MTYSQSILQDLRQQLIRLSDPSVQEVNARFFKETVQSYGVKAAIVQKTARDFLKRLPSPGKDEIWALCEELWASGYTEEALIACQWSHALKNKYEPEDFEIFESWIERYVTNWATCDTLCNHTMGSLLEMFPETIKKLKRFSFHENRWMRRASAVSLIVPAKKGLFLDEVFAITDRLLEDKDDMVQKGYGWLLKSAANMHQQEVFDYVIRHQRIMPRTALRYAIEKMPPHLKASAMART